MNENLLLEQVRKIENMELELTIFNAKRALSKVDKKLEIKQIGNSSLIYETNNPKSAYYNRIKGFGMDDLDKLDQILDVYSEQNIIPCFDMTPDHLNEEVSLALVNHGYIPSEHLVFMQLFPEVYSDFRKEINIVEVTQENAEEFVNIVVLSNGDMDIDAAVIERKKKYFYRANFHNYISYIGEEVAGIGSLFIRGKEGYIANDYTFEQFRKNGNQKALLMHRINKAKELGLEKLYTDVEFGSISQSNMEKVGFKTVFINSFWMKLK